MTSFGDFRLDQASRTLTLRGRVVEVQPKVFDLLAYLASNAGRVVPKAELMDALWPDLTVTEASLQRAVSLARTALRQGGLEDALKSFVRLGYRLAIDQPPLTGLLPAGGDLSAAREAMQNRRWAEAAEAFARTPDLSAEDLDLQAFCTECLGRPSDALPILTSAAERHIAEGRPARAGRCCANIAKIHLERGEASVARGWLARAASLVGDAQDDPAFPYMTWMQARFAAFEGRAAEAAQIADRARRAAEAMGSTSLEALALAYLGFFNLSLGHTREGLEQQDHAAAMALSSQVDPLTGGLIYCNILWSCRTFADWSRANQWTPGFETWCEANFAKITGACQLHRAEAQSINGALPDALARIEIAIAALPVSEPWAIGDAYRVRGDIHAAMGDIEAARADYARAYEAGWDAEPGAAMLLHADGDVDGALAALERVLEGVGWFSLQRRGWILAHKARLLALSGREDEARACLETLTCNYDQWPSPAIRALAAEASAALAPLPGDAVSPVQHLHLARQLWTSLGSEHQAARVRLLLARRLAAKGDIAGARVEAGCAVSSAAKVGAKGLLQEARALAAELASNPQRAAR